MRVTTEEDFRDTTVEATVLRITFCLPRWFGSTDQDWYHCRPPYWEHKSGNHDWDELDKAGFSYDEACTMPSDGWVVFLIDSIDEVPKLKKELESFLRQLAKKRIRELRETKDETDA